MQSSYPERMAACFLVDPPTLFYMAYKVLQVLLSKVITILLGCVAQSLQGNQGQAVLRVKERKTWSHRKNGRGIYQVF